MLVTLEKILTVVAKDKKVKNPAKWVEERLSHCEISSDYNIYVHLKANKRMWFGVRDTEFECKPFLLYREYNNVEEKTIKEYEFFTFPSLEDKEFFELLRQSYTEDYDKLIDLRAYYELTPLNFKIKTDYGYVAIGDSVEYDSELTIEAPLYSLIANDCTIHQYYKDKGLLEYYMLKFGLRYQDLEKDVLDTNLNVRVIYNGKELPYRLVRKEKQPCLKDGWVVEWL